VIEDSGKAADVPGIPPSTSPGSWRGWSAPSAMAPSDHLTKRSRQAEAAAPALLQNLDIFGIFGGRTRARTWDPLIKSQLLYQLSYAPECRCGGPLGRVV
jgi:hypothetical protein